MKNSQNAGFNSWYSKNKLNEGYAEDREPEAQEMAADIVDKLNDFRMADYIDQGQFNAALDILNITSSDGRIHFDSSQSSRMDNDYS
jgi:hypothetical protein